VLELELEIVHNKKNYYKTIDGKEAQSLYISAAVTKMKIKFFFKRANDLLAITSYFIRLSLCYKKNISQRRA